MPKEEGLVVCTRRVSQEKKTGLSIWETIIFLGGGFAYQAKDIVLDSL
jgi:hypothetical protein